jgi:cytochrome P450
VFRAYQEPNTFSSASSVAIPATGLGNQRPVIPVEIDPPDHTRYREILAPLFTVRRMRTLEEKVHSQARVLVEEILAKGTCDYAAEFAKELPARVFLEMMGWPVSDTPMFLDWCDKLMRDIPGDPEGTLRQKQETGAVLYGYFAAELEKHVAAGAPSGDDSDFIDWLRAASFGGERELSPFEILDCIFIVLIAGLDTTQGVLSLSMEYLADNPDRRRDLVENPQLLDGAVEELLRWFAPVLPARTLTRDVEMRGVSLKEGERLMLAISSACRDADEFPDPDAVDFRRNPNRHITFGVGAHRCLGAHLARIELRAALQEWHERIPDYTVDRSKPIRKHLSGVRGVDELHLVVK